MDAPKSEKISNSEVEFMKLLSTALKAINQYEHISSSQDTEQDSKKQEVPAPKKSKRQRELSKKQEIEKQFGQTLEHCERLLLFLKSIDRLSKREIDGYISFHHLEPYLEQARNFFEQEDTPEDKAERKIQKELLDEYAISTRVGPKKESSLPPHIQSELDSLEDPEVSGVCPHGRVGHEQCFLCGFDTSIEYGLNPYPKPKKYRDKPLTPEERIALFGPGRK